MKKGALVGAPVGCFRETMLAVRWIIVLWSLYREELVGDVLAVAAPGEGGHVAFPAKLDLLASAAHQSVGDLIVGDGELELVAVQAVGAFASRAEAALYYLALVGLEDDTFLLEIVELTGIDAAAIDEEEAEIDEQCERQQDDEAGDSNDFCFA